MKETLREMLERQAEIQEKLKALGIPSEALPPAMTYLEEYSEIEEKLDQAREQQFTDDAYEMCRLMNAASNKNVTLLTHVLRQFAEHVVAFVIEHYDGAITVQDLTDRIPLYYEQDNEDD